MPDHASPVSAFLVRKLARISGKPHHSEALSDALCELEFATRQEPGCREFAFFRALSDPDSFVLLEAFDNQAAFDLHMTLPHTQRFFAAQLVANVAVTPMDA
ncbi:MAG: putative quinol monooxygenase [Polaromonas sp.]|uniref:putative quinol monooxygenase n=1 Tax=Polaromonas sp. TaxID=1869339 RepID=UPI002487F21E|nr:putative quinol monooxygenase [Polaromonas sp.]MDI1238052.1 putative quinol monooxygenase [Polaromonas sp.]